MAKVPGEFKVINLTINSNYAITQRSTLPFGVTNSVFKITLVVAYSL